MLKDYKGACHIHTRYSDGRIRVPDVISEARDAGLDFIILSDHNTLLPKRHGWEGWHDNLLVIVGMEVTTRRGGHFLALNAAPLTNGDAVNFKNYWRMPTGKCLDEAVNNGDTTFIVHPLGKRKKPFNINIEAWQDWEHNGFAGIEIWSYIHDWIDGLKLSNLWHFYKHPNEQLKGPDSKLLSLWDKLGQERKVAGISGLDAHFKGLPFTNIALFKYKDLFSTLRTHVLLEKDLDKSNEDIHCVIEAHKEGRCYVSLDWLADATGFGFTADTGSRTYYMGDEIFDTETDIHFSIQSPHPAKIKLLRNSEIVVENEGTVLKCSSKEKGVFRVEAYLENRPWVFTNPIYVR